MSELLRLSHQLKHGCPRQKVIAWQKLVALDENALSGTEVCTFYDRKLGSVLRRCRAWALVDQQLVVCYLVWSLCTQVANAGLVPLLVALLEQVPSHKRAEVQNQAACLLLEAAACDPGMVNSQALVDVCA